MQLSRIPQIKHTTEDTVFVFIIPKKIIVNEVEDRYWEGNPFFS